MFMFDEGDPMRLWMFLGAAPLYLVHLAGLIWAVVFIRRCPGPAVCVMVASLLALVSWLVLPFVMGSYQRRVFDYGGDWELFEFWLRVHAVVSGLLSALIWALMLIASLGWRRRVSADAPALAVSAPPRAAPQAASSGPASYAGAPPQPAAFAAPSLPGKPISKAVFLGVTFGAFAFSMLLSIPGLLLMYGSRDEDVQIGGALLSCGSFFPAILGVVMLVILVYKLWAALPPQYARTTPGKAVGFLFIPFFNFYWVFQAYWGWACDHNRAADALGIAPRRASEGLAMTICVIAVASVLPFVGILLGLVNLVLMAVYFNGAIGAANAMIAHRAGQTTLPHA